MTHERASKSRLEVCTENRIVREDISHELIWAAVSKTSIAQAVKKHFCVITGFF